MKSYSVRVSDSEDIIHYKDKPYRLKDMSFVRDENHNCQMVVYATMTPLDAPMNAVIDDMLSQQFPDKWHCDHCFGLLTNEQVDNGEIHCSQECSYG